MRSALQVAIVEEVHQKSSVASCNANKLSAVYRNGSGESSLEISRTKRAKGIFRINRSVVF